MFAVIDIIEKMLIRHNAITMPLRDQQPYTLEIGNQPREQTLPETTLRSVNQLEDGKNVKTTTESLSFLVHVTLKIPTMMTTTTTQIPPENFILHAPKFLSTTTIPPKISVESFSTKLKVSLQQDINKICFDLFCII